MDRSRQSDYFVWAPLHLFFVFEISSPLHHQFPVPQHGVIADGDVRKFRKIMAMLGNKLNERRIASGSGVEV